MNKIDNSSIEDVEDDVEDLIDSIEGIELKLKKAKTQFNVRALDKAYYDSLIETTDRQIKESQATMTTLQAELTQEKTRKSNRQDFEDICK